MLPTHGHACQRRLRPIFSALAVLMLVLSSKSALRAQEFNPETDIPLNLLESKQPNIENGKALADKLCVTCHAVEDRTGSAHSDIPSFKAAANRAGQTKEKLANWLMSPHPPMPNPNLTREEIRDIGGYLLSLRDAP